MPYSSDFVNGLQTSLNTSTQEQVRNRIIEDILGLSGLPYPDDGAPVVVNPDNRNEDLRDIDLIRLGINSLDDLNGADLSGLQE